MNQLIQDIKHFQQSISSITIRGTDIETSILISTYEKLLHQLQQLEAIASIDVKNQIGRLPDLHSFSTALLEVDKLGRSNKWRWKVVLFLIGLFLIFTFSYLDLMYLLHLLITLSPWIALGLLSIYSYFQRQKHGKNLEMILILAKIQLPFIYFELKSQLEHESHR